MTRQRIEKETRKNQTALNIICVLLTVAIMSISTRLSSYVKNGLALSFNVIIPSIFPFMLLTDFIIAEFETKRGGISERIFEKIFKINGSAFAIFIFGLIGGFPIGARLAAKAYKNGKISNSELERLVLISGAPSPAFVIFAVGAGLFGDVTLGIFFYSVSVISILLVGALCGYKSQKSGFVDCISRQKYSFTESVTSSFFSAINVSAFISAFSLINGIIGSLIKDPRINAFIRPFLEIGNATAYLSDLYILPSPVVHALTAFSVAFSGLSVISQMAAVLSDTNVNIKRMLAYRLSAGSLAFLIVLLSSIR